MGSLAYLPYFYMGGVRFHVSNCWHNDTVFINTYGCSGMSLKVNPSVHNRHINHGKECKICYPKKSEKGRQVKYKARRPISLVTEESIRDPLEESDLS